MPNSASPTMSVLRIWAAMAWADGEVVPAEAEALRRLIAVAPIQPPDREVALGWLASPVELDAGAASQMGAEARRGVYQAAVRLARVDQDLADRERLLLDRLRDELGIDAATAAEIEAATV